MSKYDGGLLVGGSLRPGEGILQPGANAGNYLTMYFIKYNEYNQYSKYRPTIRYSTSNLQVMKTNQDAVPHPHGPCSQNCENGADGFSGAFHRARRLSRERTGGVRLKKSTPETRSASELIDARIEELGDWRGETLSRLRTLIRQADPDVVEEWKWRGIPVRSHAGILCTGETYKAVVKMTFAKGASLEDPSRLFNSSLEGNTRRAIDLHEGEKIDAEALKALIRAAVALNVAKAQG